MPDAKASLVPVAGPWITDRELAYVAQAAATNWYDRAGDFVGRFEAAFANYVGRAHAVSLPSCTAGLHLSLAALGVGPGDEVIVPDLTWIASAAPVSYVGATPVFADVDPITWCMRPDAVADLLTDRTRAVIAVDLYGGMPDLEAICDIAAEAGVPVVEDAAEAVGGAIGGRLAGSFGAASVFSFHGSKTITTGEGGMLVTDDDALLERILVLRDHGRAPGDTTFRNGEVAFKYKMSALQAALGLAQLERVDELVARKRQIFEWYADRIGGHRWMRLNAEPDGTTNGYWMVTVVLDPDLGIPKAHLRSMLAASGIDTRPVFDPLSSLPAYAGLAGVSAASDRNDVARAISPFGVNLPSALNLTEDQVARVCDALGAVVRR